jgi:hypothetical protein
MTAAIVGSAETAEVRSAGMEGARAETERYRRQLCPWEVRWLTVARALSRASGRLRGSYGAPGREGDKVSLSPIEITGLLRP